MGKRQRVAGEGSVMVSGENCWERAAGVVGRKAVCFAYPLISRMAMAIPSITQA
jgi:hypothetical protein